MICINCGNSKTSVVNSRTQDKGMRTWRRRRCLSCENIFTTNETVDDSDIPISISGASNVHFDTGRLTTSIYSNFAHNLELGQSASFWIAKSVKQEIISQISTQQKIISPKDIAVYTHRSLGRFDRIAAVQYAARHGLIN